MKTGNLAFFAATVARCLLIATSAMPAPAPAAVMGNGRLRLSLETSSTGMPFIAEGRWAANGGPIFTQTGNTPSSADWLGPVASIEPAGTERQATRWRRDDDATFVRALAGRRFGDLEVTWVVELAREDPVFQLQIRMRNIGQKDISIGQFPGWTANWELGGPKTTLRCWDPLTYEPHTVELPADGPIGLGSRDYSSDNRAKPDGKLPYWLVTNERQILHFGVGWCGGWQSELKSTDGGLSWRVWLPESETQLVLHPGEQVAGPVVQVMPVAGHDLDTARTAWVEARERVARQWFGGPPAAYPLIFNSWYSVYRNVNKDYLVSQASALGPFGVDAFVLDDGWFERIGNWTPAREKFQPGDLEKAYARMRSQGLLAGIWSVPWLMAANEGETSPQPLAEPRYWNRHTKSWALDLTAPDFTHNAVEHIRSLRDRFHINWWKYDQEMLGPDPKNGRMKDIIGLQDALIAIRREFPDLIIENCMSGGRMINPLTDGFAQIHWIRDGTKTGLEHARTNVSEALGAVEFLSPAKALRFTNRLEETEDPEILRAYCRSAMVGVWGLSAKLSKLSDSQREVVIGETTRYRKLNTYKTGPCYEILRPGTDTGLRGIIFYGPQNHGAAVLVFRWQPGEALSQDLALPRLQSVSRYYVAVADSPEQNRSFDGNALVTTGLPIRFAPDQLSALYFIDAE